MQHDHIAVIDVGKTNKKVLIYDRTLKVLDSAYCGFEEYVKDGVHFEDLENMTGWLKGQLGLFAKKYRIGAISVTTHGATLVCIDRNGALATPAVAYTTEPEPGFDEEFYRLCGDARELQRVTATAAFGRLINAAKAVFFLQRHFPEEFTRVDTILNMPQYFGYILTGRKGAEPTYVGCHTYLLDFARKRYSVVTERLGITGKLPPLAANSWSVLGTVKPEVARETGLPADCIVTMGIHDSNSSLLPYLVKGYANFVLNSTGTWCVAMHPTSSVRFENDEIGKLVFYNLDAFFNPVKTTIFMGGQEFDTHRAVFGPLCGGRSDFPGFDMERCRKIIAERRLFVLPSVVHGTGLFPDSPARIVEGDAVYGLEEVRSGARIPSFYRDFETAAAVLNVSLAVQTSIALGMAGYSGTGSIFTEGGFRKNATYNAVLGALYPKSRVATTRLEEATAFGAALLARAALDKTTPMATRDLFEIEAVDVVRPDLPGLAEYAAEFRRRVASPR